MTSKPRYTIIDSLRGLTILQMILYHALWDLVHIFAVELPFFESELASVWQLSIRWIFILLSGFCWSLSRNHLRRGLIVSGASVLISAVTAVFMPNSRILFGVLTLIGSGMLLMILLDKPFRKLPPYIGLAVSTLLFALTRHVRSGVIGLGSLTLFEIPESFFANYFTAYLGLPQEGFYSSDYVPIFPWLFMFWMGYFLYQIMKKHDLLRFLSAFRIKPLEWIGRHSLVIYMLHQPIVYAILYLIFMFL